MNEAFARQRRSQLAILRGAFPGVLHDGPERPPGRVLRRGLPISMAVVVILASLALWSSSARSSSAGLRGLPARERAAVAERALSNLRQVCRGGDRPREFCKEQATLLLDLPECQDACRAQARDELAADMAVK